MERYHIYKLGIAILFYAIYYRRPSFAGALSTDQNTDADEYVYYQGVQGKPGIDFPVYARIPKTTFNCKTVESGYYADLETSCQVFHICNGGAKISFLCPNGTIFQQSDLICEWWFKVNCTNSPSFYSESAEQLREGTWRKKNLRKGSQNSRKRPHFETNNNKQPTRNQIPLQQTHNGFDKLENNQAENAIGNSRNQYGKSIDRSFTTNPNVRERFRNEDARKKQSNGDRGERRFKQNNLNVRNELTENDTVNSEETQVPEETASFYKNNQNAIESTYKSTTNRYPNHKEIYAEIQEPKFYSTRTTNGFSQTISPQTFATNRIPLNDGKPFIVSTPKSSYNIRFTGYTSNPDDYNKVTTETFKYSPTVPPFSTTKTTQPTTVIPKIIVDPDVSSESSSPRLVDYPSYSSTPTQEVSGKQVSLSSNYTTPNSIKTYENPQVSSSPGLVDFPSYSSTPNQEVSGKQVSLNSKYTTPNSIKTYENPQASSGPGLVDFPSYSSTPNQEGSGKQVSSNSNYATPNSIKTYENPQVSSGPGLVDFPSYSSTPNQEGSGKQLSSNSNHATPNSIKTYENPQVSSSPGLVDFPSYSSTPNQEGSEKEVSSNSNYATPNSIKTYENPQVSSSPRIVDYPSYSTTSNQEVSGKQVSLNSNYTTPNSIKTQGVSFTEHINSFSGIDDIIHTPSTSKYDKHLKQVSSTGFGENTQSIKEYETTTLDSYYPQIVKTTSGEYGVDVINGHQNGQPTHLLSDSNNNKDLDNAHKFVQVPFQDNVRNKNKLGKDLPKIEINKFQQLDSSPVYVEKNQDKSVISSRNAYNNIPSTFSSSGGHTTPLNNLISNKQNKESPLPEIVQHNSQVTENNIKKSDVSKTETTTNSNYGDACGDDVTYPELSKEQIVVGQKKIIIDDTTVPSTETNIIKIKVNNVRDDNGPSNKKSETIKDSLKPTSDSTIFRINLNDQVPANKEITEKPNGFYVTKQFNGNNEIITPHSSTAFSSANTYLPKLSSHVTSTEIYNKIPQTKSYTYLPKSTTFSPNNPEFAGGYLNHKEILKEGSGYPQFVSTREDHLKTSAGVPQISDDIEEEFALKPKPFELPPKETSKTQIISENNYPITNAPLPDYKVSSARPFSLNPQDYEENTIIPTLPTPPSKNDKVSEHLANMLNTLREIVNEKMRKGNESDSSRPGLIIPPSVGPQTLHTLAVYFANALDDIAAENGTEESPNIDETQAINQLLTHTTLNRYRELFKDDNDEPAGTTMVPEEGTQENNDLESQNTKNAVTPRVRQLAQVFTKALSSYLDDPDMFRKVLQEARPTEPPSSNNGDIRRDGNDDDELLNYSDADIKPHLPRLPTTTTSPRPTWGYILAPNNSNSFEYNSLNGDGENLQSADSQSFVSQFNNYVKEKHFSAAPYIPTSTVTSVSTQKLPSNHWTASANATKLWKDKLYTNPQTINEHLNTGALPVDSQEVTEPASSNATESTEINYTLKDFQREPNASQVHRILIEIMNSSKNDGNKLKRILSKLNTTQEDFLAKMREIEQNPLTRRLILLLISECGSNITNTKSKTDLDTHSSNTNFNEKQPTNLFESSRVAELDKHVKSSSPFPTYVDPSLKDEDQDTRALQLLNSLYTIASKYGK